ncbi:MAG: hypothetical protein U0V48_18460 [Anaerolineales bacterium]
MFSKHRIALGLAFMLALITSVIVYAKGAFSFIAVTGGSLKQEARVTDSNLTEDFFAFSVFYENKTKEPEDPGVGYEITRYFVEGTRETAFDRLHYYPDSGFVFYDGLVNGSSEYDGEWYTAKPEIKAIFENAIGSIPVAKPQPIKSMDQAQSGVTVEQSKVVATIPQSQLTIVISVIAGLLAILALVLLRRKPSVQ